MKSNYAILTLETKKNCVHKRAYCAVFVALYPAFLVPELGCFTNGNKPTATPSVPDSVQQISEVNFVNVLSF